MRRALFALLAVTAVSASSGCCCMENWMCNPWGCRSGCGCGGGGCSSCGGDGCGCGGGGYADAAGGGGGGGGCASCGLANVGTPHHPTHSRDDGGMTEYAGGPPAAAVTYPYYANRGPRDFLARNPRSIGP